MPAANKISSVEFQREMMRRRTESQVQAEITAYLRKSGRPYTITDATVSLNAKGQRVMRVAEGWPDVTTITKDGRLFAIECKRPYGGVLRYEQAVCLDKLRAWGAVICIARGVEDVIVVDDNSTLAYVATEMSFIKEIERAIAKGPKPKKRSFKARRL